MITPDQIGAETITPALTSEQVQNLKLLVKQYPVYANNLPLFADLNGELQAEVDTPTIITQGLKAVLTALNELPALVVESQGRDTAPSHFSTQENWNSLALDVLNLLYDLPAGLMARQSFALTKKKLETGLLTDDTLAVARDSYLKRGLFK